MPAPNYPGQNIHLELPSIMNNIRLCPANSFWSIVDTSGVVHNLKDLGIQVTAYTGGGMAPIVNQTTPYALIGGSYYQRTTSLPRPLVLICYIDGPNLRGLQILRKALISYIAPNTSTQQAAGIKLRYGLTDYCGAVIGTVLEVPVNYVSGLEGNVDNLNQERFPLQFIEYAPPSIKELSTNSNALTYQSGPASGSGGVLTRSAIGKWANIFSLNSFSPIFFDLQDNYYYLGSSTNIYKNNANIQAINNLASAYAISPSGLIIVGGAFTSPQNYVMSYNGTSFSAMGATINNRVRGLVYGVDGNLYAVGDFTTPSNFFARWNGSAWSALTSPGAVSNCIANGLDGNLYLGAGNVQRYNLTAATFTNIGAASGGTANVLSIVVGPDGTIYAGGSFSSIGGISAANIAAWNGTSWKPLGPGLNGQVNTLFFDTVGGLLYAVGNFTGVSGGAYTLSAGIAVWNGSVWLSIDAYSATANNFFGIAVSQTSRILITSAGGAVSNNGEITSITNNGTANAIPTFTFTGPGVLLTLINYTTGKKLAFNYTLLTGETATLVLDPTALSFTSNFFGNVLNKILPGSDLATFNLAPGTNSISVLISGTTSGATSATLQYRNTHWSFDAGVS